LSKRSKKFKTEILSDSNMQIQLTDKFAEISFSSSRRLLRKHQKLTGGYLLWRYVLMVDCVCEYPLEILWKQKQVWDLCVGLLYLLMCSTTTELTELKFPFINKLSFTSYPFTVRIVMSCQWRAA
jgi:hypothetical protein